MPEVRIPALNFPTWPVGSHGIGWDLTPTLYRGGSFTSRRVVMDKIRRGELGQPLLERLPVVMSVHGHIEARIVRGDSFRTLYGYLEHFTFFVAWVDKEGGILTSETVRALFLKWADHLVWRFEAAGEIAHTTAYNSAARVAVLVAHALGYPGNVPGGLLMKQSRLRAPLPKRKSGESSIDKQRLEQVFEFGRLITDLCRGLSAKVIRGPRPIDILMRDGRTVRLAGRIRGDVPKNSSPSHRSRASAIRAPLSDDVCLSTARPYFLNLRIEAELFLFIAQTSMNLTQVIGLRREQYRWRSDGDELHAFRVYKGRRQGEAIFRCFKAYRQHLLQYLAWLDEVGLSGQDDRMFPFVYHGGKIPAEFYYPSFDATQKYCSQLGIKFFRPQALRKTRINWLLKETGDVAVTAKMAAHQRATLVRVYEETSHESASAEILRFHQNTDPTLAPPGPGICVSQGQPRADAAIPAEAPQPDCVSPDGCLFCLHHRDVMSAEYCFRLASHSRLKSLEALLVMPSKKSGLLPAHVVVSRLESKLDAISAGSEVRAMWVRNARSTVKSGDFHPAWETQIQLLEALSDFA